MEDPHQPADPCRHQPEPASGLIGTLRNRVFTFGGHGILVPATVAVRCFRVSALKSGASGKRRGFAATRRPGVARRPIALAISLDTKAVKRRVRSSFLESSWSAYSV